MEALFLILFFGLLAGALVLEALTPAIREALVPAVREALSPGSPAAPISSLQVGGFYNARDATPPVEARAEAADPIEDLESELQRIREERDFYRDLAEGAEKPPSP